MNLQSPSGYAMPFELTESEPLEIIKEYGGSENDFNHGIDFKVRPNTSVSYTHLTLPTT